MGRGLKLAIALDDDVDLDDDWLVEWATATRMQPDRGLVVLENQPLWSIRPDGAGPGSALETRDRRHAPAGPGRERFRALSVPDAARQRD